MTVEKILKRLVVEQIKDRHGFHVVYDISTWEPL